jgi:hypothetical protein
MLLERPSLIHQHHDTDEYGHAQQGYNGTAHLPHCQIISRELSGSSNVKIDEKHELIEFSPQRASDPGRKREMAAVSEFIRRTIFSVVQKGNRSSRLRVMNMMGARLGKATLLHIAVMRPQ